MASALRKARRERQRRIAKLDDRQREAATDLMKAEAAERIADANALNEKVKANELLKIAREKMSADLKDAYDKQLMNMKAQMEKEANQQIKHYSREVERKLQSEYRKKYKTLEQDVNAGVIGDYLTMTAKVLADEFDFKAEDLERYILELMRLADYLQHDEQFNDGVPEDKQLTVINIVKQLDEEGFALTPCLEKVDAKLQRDKIYYSFPYVYKHDGWDEQDESILKAMIEKDFDYGTIAKKLQKTEGAVKSKAYKIWKTSVLVTIKEKIKEGKAA